MRPKPIVLIVLDGWGYSECTTHNAIKMAKTPCWDAVWSNYPHKLISGSGSDVGLPQGQMGNSEVGHLHMGAGRLVPQDLMRINLAIENKDFFKNEALLATLAKVKQKNSKLHIIGLLSPGGVHSHENHTLAMIKLAAENGLAHFFIHGILDGRDTPPRSALSSIAKTEKLLKELNRGHLASLIGRFYAMDRDQRWDRTEKAYDLYTMGKADFYVESGSSGLELAYEQEEGDEFVKPTAIIGSLNKPVTIEEGDAIIFMNFRADRTRQLARAFTQDNFPYFKRKKICKVSDVVTLTQYASDIPSKIAFPPVSVINSFGEYISKQGLTQLRIAETEKYAHVTFFFNGGMESPFPGEDRILIPSPKVATYDLKPEMSAGELTQKLIEDIMAQKHDVIICNFANPDMVGHSGNMQATMAAIEVIDACLERITQALHQVGGEVIITADHGNAELMFDEVTAQPHTAHTQNPVPFIYVGRKATASQRPGGLIDIAPTMLYLLGLPIPCEMQGHPLVKLT
jgi:2,3-bisphosphoglycerate-independent phosphoglycerate mutase